MLGVLESDRVDFEEKGYLIKNIFSNNQEFDNISENFKKKYLMQ
tara:strand:- start:374 stop:505 length:132 start_codon:yes stop_codon:yes gene_type:complete